GRDGAGRGGPERGRQRVPDEAVRPAGAAGEAAAPGIRPGTQGRLIPSPPMSDLRILIVDDSVAVRRALTEAIEGEPGMSVCGAAPNGVLALELLARERPDLIVLDLEMPVMDGLEFLSRMRLEHPRLPVLVFSGTAGHANEATLEAMWRGASDYVLRPRGLLPDALGPFLLAELFPRIR